MRVVGANCIRLIMKIKTNVCDWANAICYADRWFAPTKHKPFHVEQKIFNKY